MTNKTILKTFALACLMAAGIFSCKKDNANNPSGKANIEQLGDLKPTYVAFQYNGDPVIKIASNKFLYEWRSSEKKWSKVDAELPTGSFHHLAQDGQGNYYYVSPAPYPSVYILPKNATSWELITLPDYTGTDNLPTIVANGVGDVVIRIEKSSKYVYYKKTGSGSWSKIKEIPKSEESTSKIRHTPFFLSDNGLLFYKHEGVAITDRVFNTNTYMFAKLFDKDAPENIKYAGPDGILLYSAHISSQGTIYMMYQDGISEIYKAKVLKISPTSFPAPMNILQELQIPAIEHEKSSGWSPLMTGEIIVDDAENIKTLIACNKSPETHWSYATISKGKSNIKVLDHSLSQRLIFSNRKAEAFIWVWEGYLYKWN